MARLAMLFRLLLLFVFSCVPLAGAGALVDGRNGALIGVAVTYCVWVVIGVRSEAWLIRAHRARETKVDGLAQAFESVGADLRAFRVMVYPDPAPNALMARSPMSGRGLLLLSQGLLVALGEEELRAAISECVARLDAPGLGMATFSAALCYRLLGLAPQAWVQVAREDSRRGTSRLTPGGFLAFALVSPWVNQLLAVAERWQISVSRIRSLSSKNDAWMSAERKIEASMRPGFQCSPAGAGALYLRCFKPEGGILPL